MPTERARVRRHPERADYDRATAHAILDEALYCHVGLVRDGRPVVLPTLHARDGDVVYLHGSPAAGFVRDLNKGAPVCVTATLVDGLVLARSAMHHSLNYRSVVVHGQARAVDDEAGKRHAFELLVEHVVPGRWPTLRPVTADELRKTAVLAVDLDDASAKVRTGPTVEPDEDLAFPVWAGVLPLGMTAGAAEPDATLPPGISVPAPLAAYTR
ncbi:MAG TPA: pyridoxamine 5'-phosphate oxidase family protein [Acidimicrobiales bacterium]|nr:pyridoxamine 5'-phosphate oxidase family protein [Acidimicrobiales bacterium]